MSSRTLHRGMYESMMWLHLRTGEDGATARAWRPCGSPTKRRISVPVPRCLTIASRMAPGVGGQVTSTTTQANSSARALLTKLPTGWRSRRPPRAAYAARPPRTTSRWTSRRRRPRPAGRTRPRLPGDSPSTAPSSSSPPVASTPLAPSRTATTSPPPAFSPPRSCPSRRQQDSRKAEEESCQTSDHPRWSDG